jgi:hypothetical protein
MANADALPGAVSLEPLPFKFESIGILCVHQTSDVSRNFVNNEVGKRMKQTPPPRVQILRGKDRSAARQRVECAGRRADWHQNEVSRSFQRIESLKRKL